MKHFLNLSNGIEFLPILQGEEINFVRVQSTTIERKNWIKFFLDLDHNFLFNLAIGNHCRFYDMGTNRRFSKTVYMGVPLIKYVLNRFWYGEPGNCFILSRGGIKSSINANKYFDTIYSNLFLFDSSKEKSKVKEKLKYHRRFINPSDREVKLEGISISTKNDGNLPFHQQVVKEWLTE